MGRCVNIGGCVYGAGARRKTATTCRFAALLWTEPSAFHCHMAHPYGANTDIDVVVIVAAIVFGMRR